MADQILTCNDCGAQFTFTESEQEFYQSKGFSTPGRCPSCRAARKAARNSGGSYGGSSYGGGSYGGERQMYPAVCAQCGKQTEVPFHPVAIARCTARTASAARAVVMVAPAAARAAVVTVAAAAPAAVSFRSRWALLIVASTQILE